MKSARKIAQSSDSSIVSVESTRSERANAFAFYDKKTGAARFTVDADPNGDLPLDRIAGLLAVYCVAHYCSPHDLVLAVRVNEALDENIRARAAFLLESAHVSATAVALSPREREVLRAVTNNLCNKEIAFQLSISVRTVKFHVSALLRKFGVSGRSQLSDFATARMYDSEHVDVKAKRETINPGGMHGNSCK